MTAKELLDKINVRLSFLYGTRDQHVFLAQMIKEFEDEIKKIEAKEPDIRTSEK